MFGARPTAVSSDAEGRYLLAVLNSVTLLERVRPLQSRGLFGPRDFDKNVFRVPIPTFDPYDERHDSVVALAQYAEDLAATVDVDGMSTGAARKAIAKALTADGVQASIEQIVEEILPGV